MQMAGTMIDAKRGIQPLPVLRPGTVVVLQDDPERQWKVVEQHSHQVGVSDGQRILLRNWRHARISEPSTTGIPNTRHGTITTAA
jgi:hypothetical protein